MSGAAREGEGRQGNRARLLAHFSPWAHWMPLLLLGVVLVSSLTAAALVARLTHEQQQARFAREITAHTSALRGRIGDFGKLLVATRAFWLSQPEPPSPSRFRAFSAGLDLGERYPDVQALGMDPLHHYKTYGRHLDRGFRLLPVGAVSRPAGADDRYGVPLNCYADYVRLSEERRTPRALDASVLRTRSVEARRIYAFEAMNRAGSLEQLLSILDERPDLLRFFREAWAPDEVMLPSILTSPELGMDWPSSHVRGEHAWFIDWGQKPSPNPRWLDESDLPALRAARTRPSAPALFARKFSEDSPQVLDRIEDELWPLP